MSTFLTLSMPVVLSLSPHASHVDGTWESDRLGWQKGVLLHLLPQDIPQVGASATPHQTPFVLCLCRIVSSVLIGLPSDTNEKPFSCGCGALFSRRDLLRRHERLTCHSQLTLPTTRTDDVQQSGEHEPSLPFDGLAHNARRDIRGQQEPTLTPRQLIDNGHREWSANSLPPESRENYPLTHGFSIAFPSQLSLGQDHSLFWVSLHQ